MPALLIGRLWHSEDALPGVSPVRITPAGVYDLAALAPTCSALLNLPDAVARIREHGTQRRLGDTAQLIQSTLDGGETFVKSMLERVIEERAGGHADQAEAIR